MRAGRAGLQTESSATKVLLFLTQTVPSCGAELMLAMLRSDVQIVTLQLQNAAGDSLCVYVTQITRDALDDHLSVPWEVAGSDHCCFETLYILSFNPGRECSALCQAHIRPLCLNGTKSELL